MIIALCMVLTIAKNNALLSLRLKAIKVIFCCFLQQRLRRFFNIHIARKLTYVFLIILGFFNTYLQTREFVLFEDNYLHSSVLSEQTKTTVKNYNIVVGIVTWYLIVSRIFNIFSLILNYTVTVLVTFPYIIYLFKKPLPEESLQEETPKKNPIAKLDLEWLKT